MHLFSAKFILCHMIVPRYLHCSMKKSRSFQHVDPDLSRAIAKEAERQDKNGIKLLCCYLCLRNNNKKKGSVVLKRRINHHDGKMVEPHRSRFLVLFTPCLSLLVSSTYVLQRQIKGIAGERYRETSVGSPQPPRTHYNKHTHTKPHTTYTQYTHVFAGCLEG